MDTADWILIIILVVICAIALVWFGAWLCKGSATTPGPRVTGQGEAAKNAVRTAMSVFDYLRPRSKVAVGAAEYFGGSDEDIGVELPLEQLKALILKLNPQPGDSRKPETLDNIVKDLRTRYFRYRDVSNNLSEVFPSENRNVTNTALRTLVTNLNARNAGEGIPDDEWKEIDAMLRAPKESRIANGAPTREDFARGVTAYVSKHPAPTIREAMGLDEATSRAEGLAADLAAATKKIQELSAENLKLGEEKAAAAQANDAAQISISALNETISKLENAKREQDEAIQTAQADKAKLNVEMNSLELVKNDLAQKLADATRLEQTANSEATRLKSQITELEKRVADAANDKTANEARFSATIKSLEDQKAASAAEAQAKFEEDIKSVRAQATAASESADKTISDLRAQLEEMRKKFEAVDASNKELQTKSAELQAKIGELEAEVAKTRLEAKQKDDEILALKAEVAKTSTELRESQNKLEAALRELAVLNDKISDLESKLGASKQALDEKHALVDKLLKLGKQLVQNISALREQEAADVSAIKSRLETLATKPNMDLGQLVATHDALAGAANDTAFQIALKDAMARDPVHAVASMIVTDRVALDAAQKRLGDSLAAVVALKGVADGAPTKPAEGFFGPLVDWVANMGSSVSSSIDGLVEAIKQDRQDIQELQRKAMTFETEIASMGADIKNLKADMVKVQAAVAAAPTTANIDSMRREIEYLKSEMADMDGRASYDYEEVAYPYDMKSISPPNLAGL